MLCSSPSLSIPTRSTRSFTNVTYSITRPTTLKSSVLSLQRRLASDEAASQSEPEADGATEAQHGDNSVAAPVKTETDGYGFKPADYAEDIEASSADSVTEAQHYDDSITASANTDTDAYNITPGEQTEKTEASSAVESATETAEEGASSTVERVSNAARAASDSVANAATTIRDTVGAATGYGRGSNEPGEAEGKGERSKTVYVGNLFFDVRAEDLQKEFEHAGKVVDAKVIMDQRGLSKGFVSPYLQAPSPSISSPHQSNYISCSRLLTTSLPHPTRFGYIKFDTLEGAARAIELYDLQNFEGRRLSVQYSITGARTGSLSGRKPRTPSAERAVHSPTKTLFIGNMSFDMSDRDLNDLFREVKNVIDVRVAIDRRTGQPRGFAHADFVDVESAENAMRELSGKMICGRALRVDYSTSTGRSAVGAASTDDRGS